jgi:type VII secretion protein EccB
MPSTPTTKSQVQAYRFVLRRMQSALVRKDAVMLHDPMRTHSRATIVGVCLAALGLLGFLIWGILSPKPTVPSKDGIVIGKPSGQVYVLLTKPTKRLIPVFNLASARLLLYAQGLEDDPNKQVAGSGGPGAGGNVEVKAPTVVDDNELRDQIPRDRKVGIADGPELLPSKDQRTDSRWTVCDQIKRDQDLTEEAQEGDVETTVIAGVKDLGRELKETESLLVQGPDKKVYLVYRTPEGANEGVASTVRAKVDMDDPNVTSALDLDKNDIRRITTGLLNSIPEKDELKSPNIDGVGEQPDDGVAPPDMDIGSVFKIQPTGQEEQFFVVLRKGIQQIKRTTGDLIRYKITGGDEDVPLLEPSDVSNSVRLRDVVEESTFPRLRTTVLQTEKNSVACLAWETIGTGNNKEERTSLHVGNTVPGIPINEEGNPSWVDVSTPGSTDVRIDHFYMPPGRAAVVRQSTSKNDFRSGPITLVSDRGVKYGVPNAETGRVLGIFDPEPDPAPVDILKLLPDGASLDARDVKQSYDTVPIQGGEYPTNSNDPNANGQAGGN